MYLIWSNVHRMWWRANSAGYTASLEAAGRYTREDALRICAFARDGWSAHEVPPEMPVVEADAIECVDRHAARQRKAS